MSLVEDLGISILGTLLTFLPLYFVGRYLDRRFRRGRGSRGLRELKIILPTEVNEFVALADDYRRATGFNALAAGFGIGVMFVSAAIIAVTTLPNGGAVPIYLIFDVIGGSLLETGAVFGLRRAHREYVSAVEQIVR